MDGPGGDVRFRILFRKRRLVASYRCSRCKKRPLLSSSKYLLMLCEISVACSPVWLGAVYGKKTILLHGPIT
ncbi:hypothetical protein K491DRAFT_125566 [Lophiostoma macrostomum CBS 122681]|uniref:Uncharacterized protein n=1 Tax=Lophiostoma macrostomum CBS 122681 TaxID=1314788 RepID=A0A6A6SSA1_9PLEO|nr:hypothetical protein K491DRAFT_125566 [Lophiostoma macrostomum CBS 122681]